MYRLKNGVESFTVVDGKFAGRTYERGQAYAEIPPQEKGRFEEIREAPASSETKPARANKQQASTVTDPAEKMEV